MDKQLKEISFGKGDLWKTIEFEDLEELDWLIKVSIKRLEDRSGGYLRQNLSVIYSIVYCSTMINSFILEPSNKDDGSDNKIYDDLREMIESKADRLDQLYTKENIERLKKYADLGLAASKLLIQALRIVASGAVYNNQISKVMQQFIDRLSQYKLSLNDLFSSFNELYKNLESNGINSNRTMVIISSPYLTYSINKGSEVQYKTWYTNSSNSISSNTQTQVGYITTGYIDRSTIKRELNRYHDLSISIKDLSDMDISYINNILRNELNKLLEEVYGLNEESNRLDREAIISHSSRIRA
ncbi:MAG: hypothetical protein ARM1_0743 [Candidatus Micrarchaeota archaeon]|nr:MAG: hypothetical protein ARM1_0743 [Candidatus Micrarchaeota archaeon]